MHSISSVPFISTRLRTMKITAKMTFKNWLWEQPLWCGSRWPRRFRLPNLGFISSISKNNQTHIEKFNVVSSDFYLPDFDVVAGSFSGSLAKDPRQAQLSEEIWSDLQKAYQFGSLIRIEERFNSKFIYFNLWKDERQANLIYLRLQSMRVWKNSKRFCYWAITSVCQIVRVNNNGFLQK